VKRDLHLIPQDVDTGYILTCLVKWYGAEVLNNTMFIGLCESGKIAMASRWKIT